MPTPMVWDASRVLVFIPSVIGLCALYHFTSPRFPSVKQTSWIITSLSSFLMTLVSVPFVLEYISAGASVRAISHLPALTIPVTTFFQAYLTADLLMGALYYRSQLSLLTGWIHHFVYILIVEFAIRKDQSHVFCFCAVMEYPTCVLALSTMFPKLRSNVFFTVSFFATRILFHLIVGFSYMLPSNRPEGSLMPAVLLTCIFPLHVMWFQGCVRGFIRRANASAEAGKPALRPRFIRSASSYYYRTPIPDIFHSLLTFVKYLQLDVYCSIPSKQRVYEYVGLGRKAWRRYRRWDRSRRATTTT